MPYELLEKKIKNLSPEYWSELVIYIDKLMLKQNKSINTQKSLDRFRGTISKEDAEDALAALEDCRKVDLNEW